VPSLAWRRGKWRVSRGGLRTRAESSRPHLSFHRVSQCSCNILALMSDVVETSWCVFRLVEKGPSNLTLPLVTSGNHTFDSETGRANSLFRMIPRILLFGYRSCLCINQLVLTASLILRQLVVDWLMALPCYAARDIAFKMSSGGQWRTRPPIISPTRLVL